MHFLQELEGMCTTRAAFQVTYAFDYVVVQLMMSSVYADKSCLYKDMTQHFTILSNVSLHHHQDLFC